MRILFLFSTGIYILLYYIIRYRRDVVINNITIAFPEKSQEERELISKRFYKNFADSFFETIKLFSADADFINKHFKGDFSLFESLYNKDVQKVQIHVGHLFNWEYGNLVTGLNIRYKLLSVYMPITNTTLDKIFLKLRSKTGAVLLPATNISSAILPHRNSRYAVALIADQNPGHPANAFWITFFGRPTPFLRAPENGARRGNIPVVFSHFRKIKRGYYSIHFKLAEEQSSSTNRGELTIKYANYLEDLIREQPDNWLWSHRRWKWEWKPEYGEIIK